MSTYNEIERKIAKYLDGFPLFRTIAKNLYQRVNYLLNREKDKLYIYDIVKISSCTQFLLNNNFDNINFSIFFGYYDKSPWSYDERFYLFHIWDEKEREKVKIGVYDFKDNDLIVLDETKAFNFQQGAMLRWLNMNSYNVIYNTVVDGYLVSKIKDVITGKEKIVPMPIQTVNILGREALTLNYKRLHKLRPEYGYKVNVLNFSEEMSYDEDGIWRIDLNTGKSELIISLSDLITYKHRKEMDKSQHKINHIMYSPSGKRFVFMHRWIGQYGKFSRLYTADVDGTDLYLLADDRMVSHYTWYDDEHVLAYARKEPIGDKYFLFKDKTTEFRIIGDGVLDIYGDGHPSYSPDKRWIITDTYPDKARMRYLVLYDTYTDKTMILGKFFAPWKFNGYYRCDLHPRWSPSGTKISIDSAHEGVRGSYIIDISQIIESKDI
jgi:hypothetical protein